MKIDIKIFDTVPNYLVDQIDQLLKNNESNNRINADNTLSEYSKEQFNNKKDRLKYIISLDDAKVIGIILVFKREIIFNDKKVALGGLGGVGTKKEYRGQGIATRMLNQAMDVLRESGCDIAYLDTDINDPVLLKIYGRLGFVLLNRDHVYLGKSGKKYYANNGLIAPINSELIFNEILKDNEPFDLGGSNW